MSRTSIATREQRATLVDQLERPFEHVAREGERGLTLVADGYVSVESAGFGPSPTSAVHVVLRLERGAVRDHRRHRDAAHRYRLPRDDRIRAQERGLKQTAMDRRTPVGP
jgi:hypothetical protein